MIDMQNFANEYLWNFDKRTPRPMPSDLGNGTATKFVYEATSNLLDREADYGFNSMSRSVISSVMEKG